MTSRNLRPMAAADDLLLQPATKKRRNCSKANPPSTISKLGDDLLVELLIRLPDARSAFRCKSVCKRWSSLISTPNFSRRFLSRRNEGGDGDEDKGELPLLPSDNAQSSLSFLPVPAKIRRRFKVLDSFNDLVLCGFTGYIKNQNYPELGRLFFVCNPFTKQWIALPLAPDRSDLHYRPACSLVCEPRNGSIDSAEYRFRVVRVSGAIVDMFCSESGEWTKDVVAMDRMSRVIEGNVVSCCNCNGKLYWQSTMGDQIAVWDPFRPDTPPTSIPLIYSVVNIPRIWASRGALHVIIPSPDHRPSPAGRYRMSVLRWRGEEEDGGGKWRTLYREVAFEPMLNFCSEEFLDLKLIDVLALHPSKPEIVFLECRVPREDRSRIFSCNLKTKELKFFAAADNRKMPGFRWKVFQPRFTCWPNPIPSYEKLHELRTM